MTTSSYGSSSVTVQPADRLDAADDVTAVVGGVRLPNVGQRFSIAEDRDRLLQLRQARDNAGAIIQAAQEAAARMAGGTPAEVPEGAQPSTEELEEQVAYLKAFGQAVRTQLRSYLESLLTNVETEWGRANPGAVPPPVLRAPAQRDQEATLAAQPNIAAELPPDSGSETRQAASGELGSYGRRN